MADVNPITDKQQYVNDPRIACKYGAKCYQKNPVHLQKYKHPPPKRPNNDVVGQVNKKFRKNDTKVSNEGEEKCLDNGMKQNLTDKKNEHPSKPMDDTEDDTNDDSTAKNERKPDLDNELNSNSKKLNLGRTPTQFDVKEFIKQKFLVDMPEDFYSFWEFCKNLKETSPQEALNNVGLTLVGPYDVLAGKFYDIEEQPDDKYLLHWRYYYDPPECQTIIKGDDKTGYHICYFRDSPKELPVFLVRNLANTDGTFKVVGDNIFAAVFLYLEELKSTGDPFKKMHIGRLQNSLKNHSEKLQLSLSEKTQQIRDREKKIVTRSFNKIGIVVPYNRKTQVGYRDLGIRNKELVKLFNDIQSALPEQKQHFLSKLQDIITNVSIATDECDFGSGIELGLDMLAHGVSLDPTISRVLATNYKLIDRAEFAQIIEAHMANRKKGTNLSII